VYVNRSKKKSSTVPRHREINDFLAREYLQRPGDSALLTAANRVPLFSMERPGSRLAVCLDSASCRIRS
jgi:hypothetical protein